MLQQEAHGLHCSVENILKQLQSINTFVQIYDYTKTSVKFVNVFSLLEKGVALPLNKIRFPSSKNASCQALLAP